MSEDPTPLEKDTRRARVQSLGQAARMRAARFRKVKVSQGGLAIGVVLLATIIGAYLAWRAPPASNLGPADIRFFQIVTGSTAGTYFPVGETIAAIISEPPGAEPCGPRDRCGVRGLLAAVKSSQGSTANVRALMSSSADAAFVQADIADWAYRGQAMFAGEPVKSLRAIAALYPEAVQLVTAKTAKIRSVADLRGRRVSIDRTGSGTQADALLILEAFGLTRTDMAVEEIEVSNAADRLIAGTLDAFFLIAGTPSNVVTDLADRGLIDIVPIAGPPAEALAKNSAFFVPYAITADTYAGISEVATLSVKALFVTTTRADAGLIYDITAALWRPGNRAHIDLGHVKGRLIQLQTAIDGISIPLHPGAERYYRETGRL
ncbi:TRAP transporter solute receptor, TAXI family precursor [hydrothermal vent metagenome]|uniref:TRAP transporter solute receptor, TAXI family n=1 Tax=hydrothermal vent metagenome TaxID=652676 RepID=A0A3B0S145_9ZZZZ